MNNKFSLPFRPFLVASLVLTLLGLGALSLAIFAFKPTVWARWIFFFGSTMALSGLALPVAWFLNLRFPSDPPAGVNVIVRQASWAGLFLGLVAWLQQERLASLGVVAALGLGLLTIEYLIRLRERSLWQPPQIADETGDHEQPS